MGENKKEVEWKICITNTCKGRFKVKNEHDKESPYCPSCRTTMNVTTGGVFTQVKNYPGKRNFSGVVRITERSAGGR